MIHRSLMIIRPLSLLHQLNSFVRDIPINVFLRIVCPPSGNIGLLSLDDLHSRLVKKSTGLRHAKWSWISSSLTSFQITKRLASGKTDDPRSTQRVASVLESKGHQKSILAVRLQTRKDNTQSLGILVREHCHVISR